MVLDQRVLEYEIELRQTVLMQAQQIAQLKQQVGQLTLELKELREKNNGQEGKKKAPKSRINGQPVMPTPPQVKGK